MGGKLRVGMVGLGFISAVHLAGYAKCPEVELAAFCDIIPERARKAADEYGIPGAKVYTDYKKMLAEEKPDVVNVCTENNMHAEITVAALNAGAHVFCEKPMAVTGVEADAMVAAAKKNGRKLSVGYQLRFSNESQLLRSEVMNGKLGKIYYAEATTLRRRGVPTWGVFLNKAKQGGGPLIDIGTHIVDLTLWAMNDYSPVVSAIGRTFDDLIPLGGFNNGGHWDIGKFEVEDSAFGTVTLASGAMLVVKAAWAVNNKEMNLNETLLFGVNGGAELENDRLTFNGESNDRLWQYVPEPAPTKDSMYDREIAAWVKALVEGTEPVVKCEQAAQVVKVLEAIYVSARSGGKAVTL
jgi:predicted dehydrogenase